MGPFLPMLPFTHMAIRSAVSGAGASKVRVRVVSSTAVELGQRALARTRLVGRGLGQVLTGDDVVPPEHDVRGGPRLAVGPLEALAEVEGPLRGVVVGLPRLHQSREDVLAVVDVAQRGVSVEVLRLEVAVAAPVVEKTFMLILPPYLPSVTQLCGITYGFSGSRSSTGGRLLSMLGAWLNLAGLAMGSVAEPTALEPPVSVPPPAPPPLSPPLGEQAASATEPATTADP